MKKMTENSGTELIQVNPTEFGIEPQKANEIIGNLPQIRKERAVLEEQYNEIVKMDIDSQETSKKARELRLKVKENRTKGIEVWHKTTKDFFLKGGQFVDAIKRREVAINQRMEESLEEIEKYQEIQEAKKREELKIQRTSELEQYKEYVPFGIELGNLTEEEYKKVFNGARLQYEYQIQQEKIAEQQRQEQERKAKEEEIEREKKVALYNSRKEQLIPYWEFIHLDTKSSDFSELPEESFEIILKEAKKAHKEHIENQERIKQELIKMQKDKEAADKIIAEERANAERERKKLEDALKEKEAKELKAKEEEEARIQSELNKGDADKVNDLINDFKKLKVKYSFRSAKNKKMYQEVSVLIDKVIGYIQK